MFEVWFFIIDFVGGLYCSSDHFTLSQSNCTVWASNFLAVSSVFTITSFTGRSWSESAKFWPNESTSCSEDVRVVLLLLMTVISGSMGCSSALSLSLGLAIWTLFLLNFYIPINSLCMLFLSDHHNVLELLWIQCSL